VFQTTDPFLNVIVLSFNNWNACDFVHDDHAKPGPTTVYVYPLKSTVNPFVLNFHCGAIIPHHSLLTNNFIVSPSTAAANASSNVSYFAPHICATYCFATSLLVHSPSATHL
jgi:hypothetical protein